MIIEGDFIRNVQFFYCKEVVRFMHSSQNLSCPPPPHVVVRASPCHQLLFLRLRGGNIYLQHLTCAYIYSDSIGNVRFHCKEVVSAQHRLGSHPHTKQPLRTLDYNTKVIGSRILSYI